MLFAESGLNWPVRYTLPLLPLLILATGRLISRLLSHRLGRLLVLACLLCNVTETVLVAPHFLSFANALAGGPAGGQRIFHGSNYDWGQDLSALRRWYDKNPTRRPLVVSYFGAAPVEIIGIPEQTLPASFFLGSGQEYEEANVSTHESFYWAISSNLMNGIFGNFLLDRIPTTFCREADRKPPPSRSSGETPEPF